MPKLTLIGALLFTLASCGSSPSGPSTGSGDRSGDENDVTGGDAGGGDPTLAGDAGGGDPALAGDAGGGDGGSGGDDDSFPMSCSSCHGNDQNPAPPAGLGGVTEPSDTGVGAHQSHVLPSTWHRTVGCDECHLVPQEVGDAGHIDTSLPAELAWGFPANAHGAGPLTWDGATCANVYCHGSTLHGPVDGGTVARQPEWTVVDGSYASCGDTCHTNPPGPPHANVTACEVCHQDVVSSYDSADPAATVWRDASRHIDGVLDVGGLACTSCHGDASAGHVNPPVGTSGETATTDPAVGAHEAHLQADTGWRANIACTACHVLPSSVSHSNGVTDFAWGDPAGADGANPSYDAGSTTCSGVYCHGTTLLGPNAGGSVARTPDWTEANDTWDACGETCHTTPPGGSHPNNDSCQTCHGDVISSFDSAYPGATAWADPTLHIDGSVDVAALTCTSCHGDASTGDVNPPLGVNGETSTAEPAVGAHEAHLEADTGWRANIACTACHALPSSVSHSNGVTDFDWGAPASADGASPSYDMGSTTCSGVYCHGATLLGPNAGGSVARTPDWTEVNGTWDACGETCHTTPPGGSHPNSDSCQTCHGAVISSFDPADPGATAWADPTLHINGSVEAAGMTCTGCHGDEGTGDINPPRGVDGETTTDTLAVGRHAEHVTASASHVAFACDTCHVVPAASDLTHTAEHVSSADLSTAGHHGDVTFGGRAAGMVWDVDATAGAPVDRRGTCTGACHSSGTGGAPQVLPYWAGGTWDATPCDNCHGEPPGTGRHNRHVNRENVACEVCHDTTDPTLHVNGQTDVHTTIEGVTYNPTGCSSSRPSCTGSCHGENHSDCW
jgi:predicted CxxxxCH...CXXCH cytochrome family protein